MNGGCNHAADERSGNEFHHVCAYTGFPENRNQAGRVKRVMPAAARAKISKATKARWAKFRAEKNKKGKS
jgi:hypothetical protein